MIKEIQTIEIKNVWAGNDELAVQLTFVADGKGYEALEWHEVIYDGFKSNDGHIEANGIQVDGETYYLFAHYKTNDQYQFDDRLIYFIKDKMTGFLGIKTEEAA